MMKRNLAATILFGLVLLLAVACPGSDSDGGSQAEPSTAFVGPEVWEALTEQTSVSVLIGLREPDVPLAQRTTDMMRQHTAEVQTRVLADLSEDEFILTRQFEISAALSGEITQSGVEKLAVHPDVVSIGLNCCGSVQ